MKQKAKPLWTPVVGNDPREYLTIVRLRGLFEALDSLRTCVLMGKREFGPIWVEFTSTDANAVIHAVHKVIDAYDDLRSER